MNRIICKDCFFFGQNDKTCNYLIATGEPRGCQPTNTNCQKKLTESEARQKGLKTASDILRVWIPFDEFPKVLAERRKIHEIEKYVNELAYRGTRKMN